MKKSLFSLLFSIVFIGMLLFPSCSLFFMYFPDDPISSTNETLIDFEVQSRKDNAWSEEEAYPIVHVIKNVEELSSFHKNAPRTDYNEQFFQEKLLVVVVLATSNGAVAYKVNQVHFDESSAKYCISIDKYYAADAGADVMGRYFCFIELDNELSINRNNVQIL